jgi:IS30 family transposase
LNPELAAAVEYLLEQKYSPEQIAGRLPLEFPDDKDMRVSHETIYQSLFVHGRGALRKELVSCLRSGRVTRRPQGRVVAAKARIKDMAMIADRPPEIEDRAIPGDWEGDLIIGSTASNSSIGTLVERTTRMVLLFPLGHDRSAENTRLKLTALIQTLPAQMMRSITWDQGTPFCVSTLASRSGSATRTAPGNAARTRTPTGCCASTSPKAPTSRRSLRPPATPSPPR